MNRWTYGLGGGLILAGAGAVIAWRVAAPMASPPPMAAGDEGPARPGPAFTVAGTASGRRRWTAERERTESSLRGTRVDGEVVVGVDGQLKPDIGLRHLFDYHLALIGEASLAEIRALLQQELQRRGLTASVAAAVMADFDRYVRLQQASASLTSAAGLSLPEQLQSLHRLRRQVLGDSLAQAFYGGDQAREDAELAQLSIAADPLLSVSEKRQQLEAWQERAQVTDEVRREQESAVTAERMTAELDRQQVDPETRHALRAQVWGDAAADRLADLDQRRQQWRQRVELYRQASHSIEADPALSSMQRQAALRDLQQAGFSPQERLRLQAVLTSAAAPDGGGHIDQ
ncbi:lipase secretion chaperone [Frateuria aurantia]|uniref:Lipase chaperone n=1 Tax=Frateuria aurantia (strain ATCC 33424 / DSM 6220 / KCTC 2777 / LMG 1558 / NBRC 3245 / NCIMB 13370) TaxID=767434 RepID=H8L1A3_FRAAD|nr:lipase chaperone family protein [Frateuria aurantia]AFC87511.1 lipase chaperone [Frateuria aurantia DSM 6220]